MKGVQRGRGLAIFTTPPKYLFLFLALILLLAGSLQASGCGIVPTNVQACIPVNVVNSQSSATSPGMDLQLSNIPVNMLAGNVMVYNGISGQPFSTWIESNNLVWVNLGANTIAASSSFNGILYLGLGSATTDFISSPAANGIGEAPNLSSSYAQYDNGNSIFQLYDNFSGTTCNTARWSCVSSFTINNGFNMSSGGVSSLSKFDPQTSILEAFAHNYNTGIGGLIWNNGDNGFCESPATYFIMTGGTTYYQIRASNGPSCGTATNIATASTTQNAILGVYATSSAAYGYVGYSSSASTTSNFAATTSAYVGLYNDWVGMWIRVRILPPNNINPTIVYGNLNILLPTLSISPNPSIYPQPITITATAGEPGDTVAIDYPTLGTHLATGIGTATYTYLAGNLAAGTYASYYANDITLNSNSVPQTLTVDKNNTQLYWNAQCANPTMLVFASPNPCTTTGYAPSKANQIVANLYLNNILESSTSSTSNTATYSLTSNNIGNYGFVFNTLGNGNYIANSISYNTLIYAQVNIKNVSANGNIISFAANVQANPSTWNTYFPYGFFTSSPSNTLNFTLSQLFDSALSNPTRTALQTNVLNLSYIPQSSQATGNYLYNITERQIGNAQTVRFSINAVSANMIDFNGQLNFIGQCDKYIQYFPNCAVFPYESNVFTVKPLSWSIKSDMLVLQHSNFTGAVANTEQWSNANITFTPTYSMSYPSPFGSYTVNLIDNPSLQRSITQTAFKFYTQNTVPASPYTRKITNVSTYDQQLFTPLYTNDTNLISLLMNNYTIPQNSSKVVNSIAYNTYIALSDYQNPAIYFYNSTILSSTKNHYSTVNNYCPITLTNGNFATYKPYLANLNASLYTFDIYQGSGYGATNYTMVVETGASPSSAIEVQSYKINQVPFALPLQNSQEYRFLFYNKNCTLVYTSPFSNWPQTITLYLPSNQSLGPFSYSLANAYCNTYHNSKIEYVICNGQDPTGLTSSWDVNITQPSVLSVIPVANYSFASSSFMLNWTVPNSMKLYTINIYYNNAKTPLDPLVVSYPVNPKSSFTTVESYGLMSLFFFLVMVIAAFSDIRAAIVMGLLSIFIGGIAQLNLLTLTSFAVLTIIGGTVVFLLRNKFGE